MLQDLSAKAQNLFAALSKRKGGVLPEYLLRDATGLSHGSFIAARQELRRKRLVHLDHVNRKAHYTLIDPASPQRRTLMNIFLNPGHAQEGIPDPGAVNLALDLRESDLAAKITELCAKELTHDGCHVKVLQSHNLIGESPGYPNVTSQANYWCADCFIAIHVNAGGGRGCETYCYDIDSKGGQLAAMVQDSLHKEIRAIDPDFPDRGVKENPGLAVLRGTTMPAILVETAFIDQDDDVKLLMNHPEAFAHGIVQGIETYRKKKLLA